MWEEWGFSSVTPTGSQAAADITVTPVGDLSAPNVQAALQEHQASFDALAAAMTATDGVLVANQQDNEANFDALAAALTATDGVIVANQQDNEANFDALTAAMAAADAVVASNQAEHVADIDAIAAALTAMDAVISNTQEKKNRPVTQTGPIDYDLDTTTPIVPNSLTVNINGLDEDPASYTVNPSGLSFTWNEAPLDPATHSILTSFLITS